MPNAEALTAQHGGSRGLVMTTLVYAQRYRSVGVQVPPIRSDGSKSPALPSWKHLQERPMTDVEVREYFSNGNGLAAIGGAVSGNLEDLDFDDEKTFVEWKQLIIEHLGQDFWDKLLIVRTPRPGYAVISRFPDGVESSQKLAWGKNPKFGEPGEPEYVTTIETKGEGGYFLLPGCPDTCHKTGRKYEINGTVFGYPQIRGTDPTRSSSVSTDSLTS